MTKPMGALHLAAIVALVGIGMGNALAYPSPERREARPSVPYQRAFLSWRDGHETLILGPLQNAPKADHAWIVPLPCVPEKVEACTPGTLETVTRLCVPNLVRADLFAPFALALAFLWLWMAAAIACACKKWSRGRRTALFLGIIAGGFICPGIPLVLPLLAQAKGGGQVADIPVPTPGAGASLSFEVFTPRNEADLTRWLTEADSSLPVKAVDAAKSYSKNGSCLVLLKFHAASGSEASPQPVRFVFPTKAPVCPQALSAASIEHLRFDLFVVAKGQTAAGGFAAWKAQRVRMGSTEAGDGTTADDWTPVSHPEIEPSLWVGATLTYLRGDLRGANLRDDIVLSIREGESEDFTQTVFADTDALFRAFAWGNGIGALVLFVGALWNGVRRVALLALKGMAVGLVVGFATYLTAPHVPAGPSSLGYQSRARFMQLLGSLLSGEWNRTEFPESWLKDATRDGQSFVTRGDVPGGYTLEKTATGWDVSLYDGRAKALRFHVDKHGNVEELPVPQPEMEPKQPLGTSPRT
jgi:hypothetical protein